MTVSGVGSTRERHWVCAQRLRERRLALGLTQREVVGRLSGGARPTNRALSAMENGRGLDLGLLPEFAETLDCTVTYLLGLTDDPHSWQPDGWRPAPAPAVRPTAPMPSDAHAPVPGVLGPHLPTGFAAPGRARRRGPP